MATIEGARADLHGDVQADLHVSVQAGDKVGSLETGKQADLMRWRPKDRHRRWT